MIVRSYVIGPNGSVSKIVNGEAVLVRDDADEYRRDDCACIICGTTFRGRNDRKTCSDRCREGRVAP